MLSVASCRRVGVRRIFVLDNGSQPPLTELIFDSDVTLVRSDRNLGACGGRNRLAAISDADLLLFLDDDATLDSDTEIAPLLDRFAKDPTLGVVAGLVRRPNGAIERHEFPARRVRAIDTAREVGYFLEGACILRRSSFLDIGLFDEQMFYGHESSDVSLRLARRGQRVVYDPLLRVTHAPSSHGRGLTSRTFARQMRNRRLLVWRSVPRPFNYVHLAVWGLFYSIQVFRSRPSELVSFWSSGFSKFSDDELKILRTPIGLIHALRLQLTGYRILW